MPVTAGDRDAAPMAVIFIPSPLYPGHSPLTYTHSQTDIHTLTDAHTHLYSYLYEDSPFNSMGISLNPAMTKLSPTQP